MARRPLPDDDPDALTLPPGPYDAEPGPRPLWFEPGPARDPEPLPPSPPALALWRAAEAAEAAALAALAHDAGRLAERMAALPGAAERLALAEAASLSWWLGDRLGEDRLALWLALRQGASGEDAQGAARAGWAARTLAAPAGRALPPLPAGDGADLAALLDAATGLSAPVRGCLAFGLWREPPGPGALPPNQVAREIEAAVIGARLAAGPGLPFLPLTLAGFAAVTTFGPPGRRLAGWISGAHQAVLSALLTLDRLRLWAERARTATEGLSGRTPGRLIACLTRLPLVSAPIAEAETGASRAAVQRNLDLFAARGLIREVTGQGRYRMWTAR